MIRFITNVLSKTEVLLEKLADKATVKAQAKLTQASALVTEANALRASARSGRRVAQALRDLTGEPIVTQVANTAQTNLDL